MDRVTQWVQRDVNDSRGSGLEGHTRNHFVYPESSTGFVRSEVANSDQHATAEFLGDRAHQTTYAASAFHPRRTVAEVPLPARNHGPTFITLASWEGVVEDVFDSYFLASLRNNEASEMDAEASEIFITEVSPQDRELLRAGAHFYWSIGYYDAESGQRTRQSILRFRRLAPLVKGAADEWLRGISEIW